MLHYQEITIADQESLNEILRSHDFLACNQNFTTLFIWSPIYSQKWAVCDGHLIIRAEGNFYMPIGGGDPTAALEEIRRECREQGRPMCLIGVGDTEQRRLEAIYPGCFSFEDKREYFDYLYEAERLADLPGKKFHAKRNFINRFFSDNPEWSFEPITVENLDQAWEMNRKWCQINGCAKNTGLMNEACAVRRCFENFESLNLIGGMLKAGKRVVAYSMASLLGTRAVDVHIEKAFADVDGAYPLINREMVRHILTLHPDVQYINREDDTGDEGLRQAKLSYHPDILLRKWSAVWQNP